MKLRNKPPSGLREAGAVAAAIFVALLLLGAVVVIWWQAVN